MERSELHYITTQLTKRLIESGMTVAEVFGVLEGVRINLTLNIFVETLEKEGILKKPPSP